MAKFRFNLGAVLKQREAAETVRRAQLAAQLRERSRVEDAIRTLDAGLAEARDEVREGLFPASDGGAGARADLVGARWSANAALHLHLRVRREFVRLAGAEKRVEGARQELLEAATARKAVEVLKAKRYEEWKAQERRRETAELDEVASLLAAHAEQEP